jgi:hypothetical protein
VRNKAFAAVLMSLASMFAVSTTFAQSELDFTLANKTGYGIKAVYVAPSSSTTWEENLISETLEHNEEVEIQFDPKGKHPAKWDIMVVFIDDDSKVYWKGAKLTEISKITLKYNRSTGATTAETE